MIKIPFLAINLLLFFHFIDASMPDSIENLDKIVITASRTKRVMSETPASVSVISKNTIASSPAKTIEDLLITQTGVQAKRSVSIGEGIPSDIIIRGIPGSLTASRTLILVDGIPTNASGTPFLIINEIPMDAIERIEIVRGPYSSLYGANAFGGVVNIITKEGYGKPSGTVNSETSYPFNVAQHYFSDKRSMAYSLENSGSEALWTLSGTACGGAEKIGFLASAGYRTIGNYLLRNYAVRYDGIEEYKTTSDNRDYKEFRLFSKTRYNLSEKSDVSLHVRYFKSELGFGKTKNIIPDSLDVVTGGQKILVGPRLSMVLSKNLTLRAGGFYRYVTGEFWNEADTGSGNWGQSYWNSRTSDWQAEAQAFLTINDKNTITFGTDLLRNSANFGAFVNPTTGRVVPGSFSRKKAIVNAAGYMQDELRLLDRLNIIPVARLDYHSEFGGAFSPKLGISYKITDQLRFHTSAGRSFRAPSLAELYLPDFPVSTSVKLKSNPNLKPEYIWGFDAGFDLTLTKELVLKIGPFYNAMNDLIIEKLVTPSGILDTNMYISYENSAKAWSQGLEFEISVIPRPWFNLSIHGTFEASQDELHQVPLNYVPKYLFGGQIGLSKKLHHLKTDAFLSYNFVGDRNYLDIEHAGMAMTPDGNSLVLPLPPLSSYQTLDASLRISFPKKIWILIAAQNLFNVRYEESIGNLSPGRFATIKLGLDY
jgi:outer membrane receptor for ferrienterochelin and colicins